MKAFEIFILAFFFAGFASAQEFVRLYKGEAPSIWVHATPEEYITPVFGDSVVDPGLIIYKPEVEKANGAAVIIVPGILDGALENEGHAVAQRLIQNGITCFILRYRNMHRAGWGDLKIPDASDERENFGKRMAYIVKYSDYDAHVALDHVRERARTYKVDPDRIGYLGFSNGGDLVLSCVTSGGVGYQADFFALIYPTGARLGFVPVDKHDPPAFIAAASDDPLEIAKDCADLYKRWIDAKRPAELHLYAKGGHGFGITKQGSASDAWADHFVEWLDQQGFLGK